jgi:16S rRNA (guanine966-N2)-methyltransferase
MRIIAGSRRSARLETGDARGFRPTSDRVREAVFSVLGGEVAGRRVLDLFAGSGAYGFEALSRGAASAIFVEKNRRVAAWIERNGQALRFEGAYRIVRTDVSRFLARTAEAAASDLVFVDPPYEAGLVAPTLDALQRLPGRRLVVLERDKRENAPLPGAVRREPSAYGDTVIEYRELGAEEGEER